MEKHGQLDQKQLALHHGAPEILKLYLWQKETESLIHPVLEYLDN